MTVQANVRAHPGLVYYPDSAPGIRRRKQGRGFSYIAPDDTRIDAPEERARIKALAVPPAYTDVWISPLGNGHLQATGRDDRNRKQYRYHADWTAYRAARKFDHLAEFLEALPRLRRRILRDLKGAAGEHDFAVAAVLALLDRAAMRVGHPSYTEENGSYGATTLRARHATLEAGEIRLDYRAKGGRQVNKKLRDSTLNRVLHRLDDLPGKSLVSWIDADGKPQEVRSEAVNAVVQACTRQADMTAKSFRTCHGTTAALQAALSQKTPTIKSISEAAAERLHNTATMARNSYIHPQVIDLVSMDNKEREEAVAAAPAVDGLRKAEAQLLYLLRQA